MGFNRRSHYWNQDESLLKFIKKQRNATLKQPKLLGSYIITYKCDVCKTKMDRMRICVAKPTNFKQEYKTLYNLCSDCSSKSSLLIMFYFVLV